MAASKTNKTKWNPQEGLYNYLSMEIDPYDFAHYVPRWAQARDLELPDETYPEDLTPVQLKDFENWLIKEDIAQDWMQGDPYGAPPYTYFSSVNKVPKGAWMVHFTNEAPFEEFDRGTKLEGLHLSTWKKNKDFADCKVNLSDTQGTFDVIYGFAFLAHDADRRMPTDKYGKNAVLFQSDQAVKAYHIGDEEDQIIFPVCSEYNMIPIYGPSRGYITVEGKYLGTDDDELTFNSFEELAGAYEKTHAKRKRR